MVRNRILSKRGLLFTLAFVVLGTISLAMLDGLVRDLAGEPQIWETHVRYTWLAKAGYRQCIVAVHGKPAEPCSSFTKEQIATFRLQYETPSPKVLAGEF